MIPSPGRRRRSPTPIRWRRGRRPWRRERFGRYLQAGRPSDVTVLAGGLGTDPWTLLRVDRHQRRRRIAGTHYDSDTRTYVEPGGADGTFDCLEMMLPLRLHLVPRRRRRFSGLRRRARLTASPITLRRRHVARQRGAAVDEQRARCARPSRSRRRLWTATQRLLRERRHSFRRRLLRRHHVRTSDGFDERVLSAPSTRKVWDCSRPGRRLPPTLSTPSIDTSMTPLPAAASPPAS